MNEILLHYIELFKNDRNFQLSNFSNEDLINALMLGYSITKQEYEEKLIKDCKNQLKRRNTTSRTIKR